MAGWLRHWSRPPARRLRLLCLPPAGGSAWLYRRWADRLPLDVEVVAVELPGHGERSHERPVADLDTIIDSVCTEISQLPAAPWAVFGHSMGAFVGLEVCRRTARGPLALVVGGAESPASRRIAGQLVDRPDHELLTFLVGAGGTDTRALRDEGLRALVIDALRADLTALAGFSYRDVPALHCPVRVYSGTADPMVEAARLPEWDQTTDGPSTVHLFDGGHFFYQQQEHEVLSTLSRHLSVPVG